MTPSDILAVETSECFATRRQCPICGAAEFYSPDYDACYCPACNRWLEPACSYPGCAFCGQRPARPLHPKP